MQEITKKVLERAGGVREVAEHLDLTTQAVYAWEWIPRKHWDDLEEWSDTPRQKFRPDIFE